MRPASAPCSRRHTQSVPSTHPSRGAATAATLASSPPHRHPAAPRHQCRRSRGVPSQPSRQSSSAPPPTAAPPRTTATFLTMLRPATVNKLQTLPVANDGTSNGPSSGWTSRRSACSLTAAETTSSATAFPCADDTTPFQQQNAPPNEFAVQDQEKPQCLLLSHGSAVDALMRTGTHRSLQTTPHTGNASGAPRGASPTTTGDAHTPSARTASSRKQGYVRMRAKYTHWQFTSQASPQTAPAALQAAG
ncbi:hypothetical protein MOQ_006949 [Trypanosoma cruzi marinkellei]|uniref:Uncharacterized protein n=1 Tax=Trypanosoma cruzi marinkellei TaxID=85056 RepID=K2N3P5_TRYCR|nr:hypothetical protein MOQ_006949 [Trypanosoma cruzi marinkellei]